MFHIKDNLVHHEPIIMQRELLEKLIMKRHRKYTGPERAAYDEVISLVRKLPSREAYVRRLDYGTIDFVSNNAGYYNSYKCSRCGRILASKNVVWCPDCNALLDQSVAKEYEAKVRRNRESVAPYMEKPLTVQELVAADGNPVWVEEYRYTNADRVWNDGWIVVHMFEGNPDPDWEMYNYNWAAEGGWRAWRRKPTAAEYKAAKWTGLL